MSKPLLRAISGVKNSVNTNGLWESQINGKIEKVESSDQSYLCLKFPHVSLLDNISEKNAFGSDRINITVGSRSRRNTTMCFLKISLALTIILALSVSFLWAISISTESRGHIINGYRTVEKQFLADLWDMRELSLGSTRSKEVDFCSQRSEDFVPCFNVSDNSAPERHCRHGTKQNCLIRIPENYKIPLRWPAGRDVIWVGNVKITAQEVLLSGSFTKRMMMIAEEQISFRSSSIIFDGVEDYSQQIAEMIGLRNESNFVQAGVRNVLDIGCGYGSFGAHLVSNQVFTMCIANYEASGSQVQLTLERGLPAMIGSITSEQLPYPSLSFDMIHCARCGVDWETKEGASLIEVDRILKPGGYFVWTSPLTNHQGFHNYKESQEKWNFIRNFAESICWELLSQQDETVIWKKSMKKKCYFSRRPGKGPSICGKGRDVECPYYQKLPNCVGGTRSERWIPVMERAKSSNFNSTELQIFGVRADEYAEDSLRWNSAVNNYWSLLSPLIFSDHPKRPGAEDPSPPYNMLRNVLDMNARFGGFNSALLDAGKSVWVMNVVPTTAPDSLSLIFHRGFVGVLHDWCEAFPTYPRTYDMVHGEGLLSLEMGRERRCGMLDLFTEIDRMLRPEGWVILRDKTSLIESARPLTTELTWDARVVEIESYSERLLVCQKPFIKKQAQ